MKTPALSRALLIVLVGAVNCTGSSKDESTPSPSSLNSAILADSTSRTIPMRPSASNTWPKDMMLRRQSTNDSSTSLGANFASAQSEDIGRMLDQALANSARISSELMSSFSASTTTTLTSVTSRSSTSPSTSTSTSSLDYALCSPSTCADCNQSSNATKDNRARDLGQNGQRYAYENSSIYERTLRSPLSDVDNTFVYNECSKPFCEKLFDESQQHQHPFTSKLRSFLARRYDIGIEGLSGCTAIVITSQAGAFVAHLFEHVSEAYIPMSID